MLRRTSVQVYFSGLHGNIGGECTKTSWWLSFGRAETREWTGDGTDSLVCYRQTNKITISLLFVTNRDKKKESDTYDWWNLYSYEESYREILLRLPRLHISGTSVVKCFAPAYEPQFSRQQTQCRRAARYLNNVSLCKYTSLYDHVIRHISNAPSKHYSVQTCMHPWRKMRYQLVQT